MQLHYLGIALKRCYTSDLHGVDANLGSYTNSWEASALLPPSFPGTVLSKHTRCSTKDMDNDLVQLRVVRYSQGDAVVLFFRL